MTPLNIPTPYVINVTVAPDNTSSISCGGGIIAAGGSLPCTFSFRIAGELRAVLASAVSDKTLSSTGTNHMLDNFRVHGTTSGMLFPGDFVNKFDFNFKASSVSECAARQVRCACA